jgi:hypothetical protein
MLRRIYGTKREEVKGGQRKLHNEDLHNIYFSKGIIKLIKSRMTKCFGHVESMGEIKMLKKFFGKPQGRRQHGKPNFIWEANIKFYLRNRVLWCILN